MAKSCASLPEWWRHIEAEVLKKDASRAYQPFQPVYNDNPGAPSVFTEANIKERRTWETSNSLLKGVIIESVSSDLASVLLGTDNRHRPGYEWIQIVSERLQRIALAERRSVLRSYESPSLPRARGNTSGARATLCTARV